MRAAPCKEAALELPDTMLNNNEATSGSQPENTKSDIPSDVKNKDVDLTNREALRLHLKTNTVEIPPPTGTPAAGPCWIPNGYARLHEGQWDIYNIYVPIRFHGIQYTGHVWAAYVKTGRFPDEGEQVCHSCDHKPCRNPDHVRIGTGKENIKEAMERDLMDPKFPVRQGENHPCAKMSNQDAANIKWLLLNIFVWYDDALAAHHTAYEVVAIVYHCTVAVIRRTKHWTSWKNVTPIRPEKLPDAISVPPNAVPPPPDSDGPMEKHVEPILLAYQESTNKKHFVRDTAKNYECSGTTVRAILLRKIYKKIRPDIPPADLSKAGNIKISNEEVLEIRATWNSWNGTKAGLLAALARKIGCTQSYVRKLIDRLHRGAVQEGSCNPISSENLEFKELTQRGSNHPSAKLTEDQVVQILRAVNAGEKVAALALKYKVSEQVIYKIRNGKGYPVAQALYLKEKSGNNEAQA